MRNISDEFVEKIKTNILCSEMFSENRAVYELMWKIVVEADRPQLTIWRMLIACWIPKATHKHTHTHTHTQTHTHTHTHTLS